MTPAQGYNLAKYQRPGFKVVMGAEAAKTVKMTALLAADLRKLPGPSTWLQHDLKKKLGYIPCLQNISLYLAAKAVGYNLTDSDWRWMERKATSLSDMRAGLSGLCQKQEAKQ